MKKTCLTLWLCLAFSSLLLAGTNDPVAVLFQVKGDVEYSKNGSEWKKAHRNKFLFSGYSVRSGETGSGVITNRLTGKNSKLLPNTTLVVTSQDLEVRNGELSPTQESNKLISGLIKRFSRSQAYTTVRRSANQRQSELDFVRHIVLTDEHPYLVWENLNAHVRYELTIGPDSYRIEPSEKNLVRVKIKPFSGTQTVAIKVYQGEQMVTELQPYKSRGAQENHTVHWMSDEEKKEFTESIQAIAADYLDNSFMLGSYFEKEEMWTAAMDQYKQYLENNQDEIEMTPYLFRVYKKLKLKEVYKNELNQWAQAMKE